jgi:hypothetical protein
MGPHPLEVDSKRAVNLGLGTVWQESANEKSLCSSICHALPSSLQGHGGTVYS